MLICALTLQIIETIVLVIFVLVVDVMAFWYFSVGQEPHKASSKASYSFAEHINLNLVPIATSQIFCANWRNDAGQFMACSTDLTLVPPHKAEAVN
jgi:hypothetical protein